MMKSQQMRSQKKAPRSRPYSCDVCPKQFETPSKLARHYLSHTGQKPFQCQHCNKTFRQLVHLERHVMTHDRPFQCDVCHRHFKTADTFSKHERLHVEGPRLKGKMAKKPGGSRRRKRFPSLPLYCFGCQRTFESEEKRLLHQCDVMNVTARCWKAETQQCSLCDKVFPSPSKLERHVMIHTGQKPFACVHCGKAFRQKAHLKIHELTHSREKPFPCSQCFRSFKAPEQLLRHEEMHADVSAVMIDVGISASRPLPVKEEPDEVIVLQFHCSECDQSFDTQQTLDDHVCEGMNAQVAISCDRAPVRKTRRPCIYLGADGVVIPVDSEPERPLKAEHLKGAEHRDPDTPEHQQFTAASNISQLHLPQKGKPPRRRFGHAHLLRGRRLRRQRLNDNRIVGNEDAGNVNRASALTDPGHVRDTFHHLLQQAEDILLPRHKVWSCNYCEKSFPSMSKLRRHYLIHTGQKPFSCADCGRSFRQSAHLKRHQVTHTEKDHLCGSRTAPGNNHSSFDQCKENPSRRLHQRSRRPAENSQDIGDKAYGDVKVEAETPDLLEVVQKPAVTKKSRVTLPRVRNAKSSQERTLPKMRARAGPKLYSCNLCSKSFRTPSKLERHCLTHSGQRPFVCQECGKSFQQDPHLKRHMVTHVNTTG